mgnify:CR=1 FL=1
MINIGLIGFGYWGPNLARNFSQNPHLSLAAVCDASADRLQAARRLYPRAALCDHIDDFFRRPDIDAVAIATPVGTHYELARRALETGRHVWLEKPMTDSVESAERLIELCARKSLTVATAESCTGGLVAAVLTAISGSSRVVDRGYVTYSNLAKQQMLGVTPATLDFYGAVSPQCAEEMVKGALAHAGVIGGADMTVEATLTKLHYLLSQELDTETIRKAMSQNLRGELTPDD